MTTNEGKKRRCCGGCGDWGDWAKDILNFDKTLPVLLGLQFLGLVGLIIAFVAGWLGEGAIPKQYYSAPWGGEAVTNVMGLEVDSAGKFFGVAGIMAALSFMSALTARAMSIWEWEMVNFSDTKPLSEEKTKSKNGFTLAVVSLCGTFFLSITSVVNLFFSVTSLYYLIAAALGRVAATGLLTFAAYLKRTNAAQKKEDDAARADGGGSHQLMFRKYR